MAASDPGRVDAILAVLSVVGVVAAAVVIPISEFAVIGFLVAAGVAAYTTLVGAAPKSRRDTRHHGDSGSRDGWRPRRDVMERCLQHPWGVPENHDGHRWGWTGANGVFYCHTCGEWYRVWGPMNEGEEP